MGERPRSAFLHRQYTVSDLIAEPKGPSFITRTVAHLVAGPPQLHFRAGEFNVAAHPGSDERGELDVHVHVRVRAFPGYRLCGEFLEPSYENSASDDACEL